MGPIQGLGSAGLLGMAAQQQYDPYEQMQRQLAAQQAAGMFPIGVQHARNPMSNKVARDDPAVTPQCADEHEHNRKLLLLED